MDKEEISERILEQTKSVSNFIKTLDNDALNRKDGSKWSVAENAVHLVKSVSPINIALSLPKFVFIMFGTAESSRDYGEIVSMYNSKLSQGATASRAYVPKEGRKAEASRVLQSFDGNYRTLVRKLEEWSENDLDRYRLPHPILGKLTIREMLYFTLYHLGHHLESMKAATN